MQHSKFPKYRIENTFIIAVQKKSIDFEKGNHVSIEYKLSPFPEIENYLEKIE